MEKYDEELQAIENKNLICCFKLDTGMKFPSLSKNIKQFFHPNSIKSKSRELNFYSASGLALTFTLSPENFLIMIGIFFTYISSLTKKSHLETIHIPLFVSRELVKYFLQIHIRKNLKKLYELYLRELVINQNTQTNSKEIQSIREITSDIESLIKILPSARKLFASTTSIGFAVFAIIPLIGINLNFIDDIRLFYESNQLLFIVIMIILYFFVFLISFPFKHAFKIKRTLLLQTNMFDYFNDYYPKKASKLYENSIYKIENDLYDLIKSKNIKPLEMPFDRLWDTVLGIAMVIFVTGLIISIAYEQVLEAENFYEELGIFLFIIIIIDIFPIWHLIVNPFLIHRSRKKLSLI